MSDLGNPENPLKVAIVGSGPSGFYAAEALLSSPNVAANITMIDKLPTPFGLVRSGVAPDHQNLKQPIKVYDRIAQSDAMSFLGNVEVGRHLSIKDLRETHHAVIFAYGAGAERALHVPGADLKGCYSAGSFVGWYNGHPDFRDCTFDLAHDSVVIIGQGNVALDVARVLSKSVEELRKTDIAKHALEVLSESRIRDIQIIGRRGPAQAKFSPQILKEWNKIAGCQPVVRASELILNEASVSELSDKMNFFATKNLEILRSFTQIVNSDERKSCHFRFNLDPVSVDGADVVQAVECARTSLTGPPFKQLAVDTAKRERIACGAVFSSLGFRGNPISDLPFVQSEGVVSHRAGRILDAARTGLYACGWIKRGASGTIGSNRADSLETVATLLSEIGSLDRMPKPGASGLMERLRGRSQRWTSYQDWQKIDRIEVMAGAAAEKPREKMTRVDEMLQSIE